MTVPSLEDCVKIQSKVKRDGIETASVSQNFITTMSLVRFFYNDHTGFPVPAVDGHHVLHYVHPCKGDKQSNMTCVTYRIDRKSHSKGLYCYTCEEKMNTNSRSIDNAPQKPLLAEECIELIRATVQREGIAGATASDDFVMAIKLLRFFHSSCRHPGSKH